VIGTLTTRCTQVLKNGFKWLEFKTWLGELLEAPAIRQEATDFQSQGTVLTRINRDFYPFTIQGITVILFHRD
jgi:hypothetical protein